MSQSPCAAQANSRTGPVKMAREGAVKYLNTAKSGKNDEFYTILSDIEKEMVDSIVKCNGPKQI